MSSGYVGQCIILTMKEKRPAPGNQLRLCVHQAEDDSDQSLTRENEYG